MKVEDYDVLNKQELTDFKDDVTNILNFGKYGSQIVNSAPNWAGKNGEFCFYINTLTNVKAMYVYLDEIWYPIQLSAGIAKSWASFGYDGASLTIYDSYNVASVARRAAGRYTVTYATTFATTNYYCLAMGDANGYFYVEPDTALLLDSTKFRFSAASDPLRVYFLAGGND
jgi:hypothetical protein